MVPCGSMYLYCAKRAFLLFHSIIFSLYTVSHEPNIMTKKSAIIARIIYWMEKNNFRYGNSQRSCVKFVLSLICSIAHHKDIKRKAGCIYCEGFISWAKHVNWHHQHNRNTNTRSSISVTFKVFKRVFINHFQYNLSALKLAWVVRLVICR